MAEDPPRHHGRKETLRVTLIEALPEPTPPQGRSFGSKSNMARVKAGTPATSVYYTCKTWETPRLGADIHITVDWSPAD